MTFEEIKKYFGSSYRFSMITKMAHTNYKNWEKKNYIPYLTQKKIELLTNGELKADYNDGEGKIKNAETE